jgi:membrane-associated phospholipid phosphatase
VRRHVPPRGDSVERAPPVDSVRLADATARLDLADAVDPVPLLPRTATRTTSALISASCSVGFAILAMWISQTHAVPSIDRHIHAWVLMHRSSWNIGIARTVRWGGMSETVLPALLVIGTVAARGRPSARLKSGTGLIVIASSGIYVETRVNELIGRVRPPVAGWAGHAAGPSFPSGHTTTGTLFAVCCAWALMARVPAGWPRRATWAAAALYAVIVGWSRVWLGVHWPTDVLGGFLFSVAWTSAIMAALPARSWRPWPVAGQRSMDGLGPRGGSGGAPKTATAESPSSGLTPSGPEVLVTRRVCHGATRPPGRRPGPGCQLAAGPVSSLLRILAASGCCMSLRMASAARQAVHAASWAPLA